MAPLKKALQAVNPGAYTFHIAQTTAIRAWPLDSSMADDRQPAVFFRPYAFARPFQWRALAEGTPSGVPVPMDAGRPTPKPCARHLPLGRWMAGFETVHGGRIMRRIVARPEQALLPNILTQRYPLFGLAGRNAAELWLLDSPDLSMADWRDLRFYQLTLGNNSFVGDAERRKTFNESFARQIALSIANQSRKERRHA
ncbi:MULTISPECIES: hypothetical protein [Paraburkholderia]|uniref:hypothetical protein n=1 Tax=Paraburkholderia TaxID=1822464 RepID=UPI00224F4B0A|nr:MULTISPECIES: hypothetical protein [Paraburkholderia]MCX4156144.1 hypothetical protein [Paraburkholderia aspalathi]MDN7165550.1 hypothetical protein [Paraburkholderia sp. SECH2]MDQ6394036.1 hypothetical protein [Paraburkholderia aspalathi]